MDILFLAAGVALGYTIAFFYTKSQQKNARLDYDAVLADAERDAKNLRREAELKIEEDLSDLKTSLKEDSAGLEQSFADKEEKLNAEKKELAENFAKLIEQQGAFEQKLNDLNEQKKNLQQEQQKVTGLLAETEGKLAEVAALDPKVAEEKIIQNAEQHLEEDLAAMTRKMYAQAKEVVDRKAQDLLLETMQRYTAECSYDRTTATVHLPSDDVKGRIIGRDGRNIHTIEALTGANVLIDDTPESVVVSCFEPYRREVARVSLERLVEDGRIHPNVIHDVVNQVRIDLKREMAEAAEFVFNDLNIPKTDEKVMRRLGRLKYRFNSSQNLLQHAKEVAAFMGIMAAELKLDVATAKHIGALHCIGKAFDEHTDEDFVTQGADFLKRNGEPAIVIESILSLNTQTPEQSPMATLLKSAVTLSESRPGAQVETMEFYIKRLHHMEKLARQFKGVRDCYVLQAGRELVVFVHPDQINDDSASILANDIARKLDREMEFPGPVFVSVHRETVNEATID